METQKALWNPEISREFSEQADAVILEGDCLDSLRTIPDSTAKLIITSPPYNLGKAYETATDLDKYFEALNPIVDEYC